MLDARPDLAANVFAAFAEAKRLYVDTLSRNAIEAPGALDRMHARVMEITGRDPLPYGIEPNRKVLEELIGSAMEQSIITRRVSVDDMFAPQSRGLVG